MITEDKLSNLLGHTKTIIDHQREMKKARGENFNVFSVLSMERSENKTHSAFLAELLNPKGTHLKGSSFLKLFLKVLKLNELKLDIATAQVQPEYYIGPRDDKVKTGGRIDIYIWDKNGNSISIENKIYAGDQDVQIERYCNYRKGKNKVLYLTLKGAEPSAASKGELQNGTDFYTISYRDQVQEWLDRCIKESAEQPILRESIKQYKILIQKLTSTMGKTHQKNLNDVMLKHIRESAYIYENFAKVSATIKEGLRQSVFEKLKGRLITNYSIVEGWDANNRFSQIWIKLKGVDNKMFFGLESFSGQGHKGGNLFIGVYVMNGKKNEYTAKNERFTNTWYNVKELPNYDGCALNFSNADTLQNLYTDSSFKEGLVEYIVSEVEAYLDQHANQLRSFLATDSLVTAD
ncbi:PDDEXK-like family protein [Pontibacter pudoricolor]|uniref:PDDEXK-like family protein n=1 Tax=Pontibacter pudoricolor TaxID=2694930 RepID=UPI001391CCD8|nr:PD-(D/E)XK nuclease family protein [Pontibacter pudoricolor]